MIDLHHDLLSIIYYSYLKNDFSFLNEWLQNFGSHNVSGLIANLYFMNEEEMKKEVGNHPIHVLEIFRIAVDFFKKHLPTEKVIFSIEGCDYIQTEEELEELYRLGLRSILLVWNNPNIYGSGNRGDYGLTEKGKSFLMKAIDLGIVIDLSHMNEKTFYDTISLIQEQRKMGKQVKVIASHSNCFDICQHPRNLSDEQLLALKSVDGIIGIVGYDQFVRDEGHQSSDLVSLYLEHIHHAVEIMGIDHVSVATDDMVFCKRLFDEDYGEMIFDYQTVSKDIRELLLTKYSMEDVSKIMIHNIYNKIF